MTQRTKPPRRGNLGMSRTRQELCWARRAPPLRGRMWRSRNLGKLGRMLVAACVFAAAIGLTACGGGGSSNQQSSGSKTPSLATTTAASSTVTATTAASTTQAGPCSNPHDTGHCLGKLAASIRKNFGFPAEHHLPRAGRLGQLRGQRRQLPLASPGETLAGVNDGTSEFIGVYSSVAAPNGCRPGTAPHVGL